MKKYFAWLFCTLFFSSFFSGIALADNTTPAALKTEVSDGQIKISMYSGFETDIIIPDQIDGIPVTAIGDYAFSSRDIVSISIPDGVISIGDHAFEHCRKLQSVKLPSGLKKIGASAFADCPSLETLRISSMLIQLEKSADNGSYAFNIRSAEDNSRPRRIGKKDQPNEETAEAETTGKATATVDTSRPHRIGAKKPTDNNATAAATPVAAQPDAPSDFGKHIVGIITGDQYYQTEEYESAQYLSKKYPNNIRTINYSGLSDAQSLTNIAMDLAKDGAEVIIIIQGPYATYKMIDAVHAVYPDVHFIVGLPADDINILSSRADLVFVMNSSQMGADMVQQAWDMGAKTFVYYSFPRHITNTEFYSNRQKAQEKAASLGMKFVYADTLDPAANDLNQVSDALQKDMEHRVSEYGSDTAFFHTNCTLQPTLINTILKLGAYYPQQCCPSPYHGYPEAFSISIPISSYGDSQSVITKIKRIIDSQGGEGHFSTWEVPGKFLILEASTLYSFDFLNGKVDSWDNQEYWKQLMNSDSGKSVSVDFYNGMKNVLQIKANYIVF